MLLRLILPFLLAFNLYGISNSELLKRADSALKSGNKSKIFTAYNDYKNLYLQALMSGDSKLKNRALNGIVASGTKLHIDVSDYKKKVSSKKQIVKKSTNKTSPKKIHVINIHSISSAKWKENELILTFSKKLTKNRVNYFKIEDKKKKSYRYIFDIKSSLLGKNYKLKKSQLKRVSMSQYKHEIVRLVIEHNKRLKLRFYYEDNRLIIKPGIKSYKAQISHSPVVSSPIKKNKIIVIDPGHGGKDSGAVGYKKNIYEKDIVYKISKELSKILNKKGYKVYLTRNKDSFIKLSKRTEYANKRKADMFISIHANAIPRNGDIHNAKGVETYFLSPAKSKKSERVAAKENVKDVSTMNRFGKDSFLNFLNREKIIASNKLGIDLQQSILKRLRKSYSNVKDGGVRKGPFWVLVGAQMPAVLVEVGFVSNPMEAKRLITSSYQKRFAQGMAEGIERYFLKNQ
ncbi:MAG: N-acetylmuramoyl-L-alanine amidase [Campylobacterota bacterium]|nr:N-acetylmuramoyl-L-alanine amidase [Campylobacterota bacterium]